MILHHANIILSKNDCRYFVFEILEKSLNFNIKANPDFSLIENESFGIDDARNLERWVMGKPLMGEVKVSLIIIKSITSEAQNALLKVLEEPPLGTYIFINLENLGGILPTFVSRVRILNASPDNIENDAHNKNIFKDKARQFLNSKIKERLSMIRSLSKNEDKNDMKEIIKNLEIISYENHIKNMSNDILESKAMKNILTAKVFAATRGSSPKMLLEWLSCVL
jgi:DNA polymerase III delta prime subunit